MRGLAAEKAVGRRKTARTALGSRAAFALRAALVVSVAVAAGCVVANPAHAGVYHVYSCRTPAGAVAPTGGWSGSINGPWMEDANSCASGGSLTAALDGGVEQPANASAATWTFSAPAGTSIAAARLWRAGEARTSRPYGTTVFSFAAPEDIYSSADVFDKCENAEEGCPKKGDPQSPMAPENLIVVPSSNLSGATHIYMSAACGGGNGTNCPASGSGYSVWVSLYAADITLADNTPPTFSSVGGSLVAGGTLSGVEDISFSATDTGSGLYQAVFSIDGRVVAKQLLSSASGPCRNVGGTSDGTNAFFEVEPCPLALSDDLSFDTALAPEGSHLLTVQLLDAAGNATTILKRQVSIANHAAGGVPAGGVAGSASIGPGSPAVVRGAPNGTNASDQAKLTAHWAGTSKQIRASRYGAVDRVTGRLTAPGGVPISGASLNVYETSAYEGARTVPRADVDTGPTGEWSLTLPRGVSSSMLSFDYRSHLNDTVTAASARLRLSVHAGIALRIAPRVTSVGRSIFFSGALHGTPIPPGGKQLELEARSENGQWIQFDTIGTGAKGRYRARYRFKFAGPIRYEFRVVSRHEADFPFLDGASNIVDVHER